MSNSSQQQSIRDSSRMNAANMLRKLQRNSRASIPAIMAKRSMSVFTLQPEPLADEATSTVFVCVYPQNPFVGEPEVRRMLAKDIQPGLVNSRVQIQDSSGEVAQPDTDGNYLYWPGKHEFDQINAFYYTTFTLRMFEGYAHHIIPWSYPAARITVDPHIGDLANAFYNEEERLLGFHSYEASSGEMRSTAQSADIVSHEAAHAILDGLRDLYNESFGLGTRAFHESFGDIAAMLVALHDDSLIRRLLKWTNGNLRMSNFITEVAESLTKELEGNGHFDAHTIYLRNAFNTLKNKPFDDLPYDPQNPETEIGRQEHNYSRLFTGAIYDVLVGVYEQFQSTTHQPEFVSLVRAREVLGHLIVMAIELGPVGELDFGDMAKSLLTADSILYDGEFESILTQVFDERGILPANEARMHMESLQQIPDVRLPDTINHALAAAMFLDNSILPALAIQPEHELLPMATYRNVQGYAFMTFFSSTTMRLSGAEYELYDGVDIDVFGGLTLVFNGGNRLCSVCYRPVTEEDVRQIRISVSELIEHNNVVDSLYPPGVRIQPNPKGLLVPNFRQSDDAALPGQLVAYPVFFDEVPQRPVALNEYLQRWKVQSDT